MQIEAYKTVGVYAIDSVSHIRSSGKYKDVVDVADGAQYGLAVGIALGCRLVLHDIEVVG